MHSLDRIDYLYFCLTHIRTFLTICRLNRYKEYTKLEMRLQDELLQRAIAKAHQN